MSSGEKRDSAAQEIASYYKVNKTVAVDEVHPLNPFLNQFILVQMLTISERYEVTTARLLKILKIQGFRYLKFVTLRRLSPKFRTNIVH